MPEIVHRVETAYVGLSRVVRVDSFAEIADQLPPLISWLQEQGVEPADAPFLRYLTFFEDGRIHVEAGVPVDVPVDVGDTPYSCGALPAGRYVAEVHVGSFEGLADATARALEWGSEQGLAWDRDAAPGQESWGCRLEAYEADPLREPDPSRWRTRVLLRLAQPPQAR
ncbi:GyrI-like domain-containing protein [Motilibacter aurantiacus]|uniref:GyrI-like domain-containing protein n=1 Tax=Motilibacter aurantiacus TaxID=2714955 RepID=UPI00140DED0D|nr:GyrI-like domain-containing protein [Motilibacter aurantiacus]